MTLVSYSGPMTHNVDLVPLTLAEVAKLQETQNILGLEYSYTYDEACEDVPALLDDDNAARIAGLAFALADIGFDVDDPKDVALAYRPTLVAALLGATSAASVDDVLTSAFNHLCPAEVPGQTALPLS